jgi:putative addiction module component (TIGR02574 family)
MSDRTKEILKAALALSPEELAELVDELNIAAADHASPEVGAAWAAEIERRLAAFDAGQAEKVSWEDIRARLEGARRGEAHG